MTTTTTAIAELKNYRNAGYPIVAVRSVEERRFLTELESNFKTDDDETAPRLSVISAAGSLLEISQIDGEWKEVSQVDSNYRAAFVAASEADDSILIVFDFQHIIGNGAAYRMLLDRVPKLKSHGSLVVLVAPDWKLPKELEHEIAIVDHGLPTRDELNAAIDVVADVANHEVTQEHRETLLDAACGLTFEEAESAFALSWATHKSFDATSVEQQKMNLVKQSGFLEYWPAADQADVGGLGGLKSYLADEVLPVKHDEQLRVRGMLLVGVPGTGKSLSARAAGSQLGWPVLRLDVASLKGGLVGQSESNMRSALALAEAVSPCVLWLDEIEKGVGGVASSASTDGGTTLGMVGQLLNWLQEHRKPILTIGTCNDYDKLPAELTRAGRFDERFFVDLPIAAERSEIAAVHLDRFNCDCDIDATAETIRQNTKGFTGAEIEQLVKSVARRTGRKPRTDAIIEAAKEIKPISVVKADDIKRLQEWATTTLRTANTTEAPTATRRARSLRRQDPANN